MPIQVYILHHEKDVRFLEQIELSLTVPIRNNLLKIQHANSIFGGQHIEKKVQENLRSADVIVVLCSSDLFASKITCRHLEQIIILQQEEDKVVIPILLRPFLWEETEISTLSNILPKNKKSILTNIEGNPDEAHYQMEEVFYQTIKDFLQIIRQNFPDQDQQLKAEVEIKENYSSNRINTKLYEILKAYLKNNEAHTQTMFALAYPSSLPFLEDLTSKSYIGVLRADNILKEEERGWLLDFKLSEYLRQEFEIDSLQLNDAAQKGIDIFKEELQEALEVGGAFFEKEKYNIQDLFNVIHLLFHLYVKKKYRSIEDQITAAFSIINFRKANDPLAVKKLLNEFLRHIHKFKIKPELRVKAMNNFIAGLDTLGHYEEALKHLRENLEYGEQNLAKQHLEIAKSQELFGNIYYEMGDFKASIQAYLKSLKIYNAHPNIEDIHLAILYQNIARPYYQLGGKNRENAIQLYEKARKVCTRQINPNARIQQLIPTIIANLAVLYEAVGDYDKAIKYQNEAIQIKEKLWGNNNPSVAFSLHNLGTLYQKMGKYALAVDTTLKSLKIRREKLGSQHPHTLLSSYNLATNYFLMERYDEAQNILEELRPLYENNNSTTYFLILEVLGRIHTQKGTFEEALDLLEKSFEEKKKFYDETHIRMNSYAIDVGNVYYRQKNYKAALEKYEEALIVAAHSLGREHTEVAFAYFLKGKTYLKTHEYHQSLKNLSKSLKIRQKTLHDTHPDLALTYQKIAQVFRLNKTYSEVVDYNEKALDIHLSNRDTSKAAVDLAYLIDAYLQNQQIEHPQFLEHLNMASKIQDGQAYKLTINILIKLKSFENKNIDTILQYGKNKPSIHTFLKDLGLTKSENKKSTIVKNDAEEKSLEESMDDMLNAIF
ncbi:MAG: tetratricopeptide repeat protein [Chitinophagales bacterium]